MSDLLVHRGPDSGGEHVDGVVALAARRLSIIDLEHGDQPIANEDGSCVVVQNGEIYNYPELRRELERAGHQLRTRCDTEALVHLYEEHGPGFAERLRGMFAAATSAALAALAAQETPEPVHTFTIGFAERSFDERADARRVAERYGTEHHELLVRPEPELLLRALADAFDEPFADSSALPTYLVSRLAAEHVKVALSGEGGDELFGGYYTYAADLMADRLAPLARAVRPLVEALPASTRKASLDYKAKRFVRAAHLPPLERHHGWKEIFSANARAELTGRRTAFDPVDVYRARYAETAGAPQLARLQDVDFGVYLVDDLLVKTDRASMAHSLEARVPFLDPLVTNLAFALPTRLKVRGLAKKVLLRKAVEPLLPAEVVHGRKRGFSIPAAAWLRGELAPFARATLSPENLRRQGFFQAQPVTRMIDEHVAGREDWSRQLWGLLAFTLWYERHVEQEPPRLRAARMGASVA